MNNASQTTSRIEELSITNIIIPVTGEETDGAIHSLAPKVLTTEKDLARVKPYLDLLKKIIDAPGITNIALTGNYGSGKSTIINTFQSKHNEYEYLRISLASFGNVSEEISDHIHIDKQTESTPAKVTPASIQDKAAKLKSINDKRAVKEKKEELERLLEVSILQQIFYHVKPSTIPDSRFKRITNIKEGQIFMIAASFSLWIASIFILFKFDFINRLNPSTWSLSKNLDIWAIIVFLIFFAGIGVFAKNLVRLLNNSKINKVNIKGELELGDKLDKSVFNEHLEEILYFFERTKFNLVVIEDLDRFDSTDIFTKLRELNTLLNNSLSIKERKDHKKIVFLYAVSDETFKDKNERVKFFEYIIPVIPFINPSNAGEQLGRLILDAKIVDPRFKEFTEDLVTFIDDIDMRLLTNIFHEYQLYRDNLSDELAQDKLFSIITYKNMFPEDFSKLHNRKGILYEFISGRETYTAKLLEGLNQRIEDNNEKIEEITSLKVEDVEDLKALYIKAIYTQFSGAVGVRLSKTVFFSELIEDTYFTELTKQRNIQYVHLAFNRSYGMYNENLIRTETSFADLEEIVNPGYTYLQRKKQILEALNGKEQIFRKENDKLLQKKQEIDSWSLSEIFEEVDIDPYINKFSSSGLIKNLLINGYIDENYSDYISLFHEVNMSADDFTFEKRVKSGTSSPFEYKLTSTDYLVKKLNEKYFKREVILNLDLMSLLLSDDQGFMEKKVRVFTLLSNERERSLSFIDHFTSKRPEKAGEFIKNVAAHWPGLWNYLEKKSGFSYEKLDNYLKLIVRHANIEDIKNLGKNLNDYISRKADFLSLFDPDQDASIIKNIIEKLAIKFETLAPSTSETRELFDYVYEKSQYQINIENVLLLLGDKDPKLEVNSLKTANYTSIMESDCVHLRDYINGSIDSYITNVFLKLPDNKNEKEEYIIGLLNNTSVDDDLKISIISGKYISVSFLEKITDFHLKEQILIHNTVSPTWNNIFNYYDEMLMLRDDEDDKTFDQHLVDFFNNPDNYPVLSKTKMSSDDKRDSTYILSFAIQVMTCNELDFEVYVALMDTHFYNYDTEEVNLLDEDKVSWAVENSRIDLNKEMYDLLKANFSRLHIRIIELNQNNLDEKFDELEILLADSLILLSSDAITAENKLVIYDKYSDQDIISNSTLSRLSCPILLANPSTEVSYEVMESIFKSSTTRGSKIALLNLHLRNYSNAQVENLIIFLGGDYPELFMKRHRPKFSKEPFHTELFTLLRSRNLIKSFDTYNKDETRWQVSANYN